MIATLKEKQVKNYTSPTAKALVLIDLGNGDVKALGKMNGTDRTSGGIRAETYGYAFSLVRKPPLTGVLAIRH